MKQLQLLSVGLVALSLFGASQATAESSDTELYAAAKTEGPITWYNGTTNEETATKIVNGFIAKYPGLKVNSVSVGAQVVFQRVLQELDAQSPQSDVYSSTDITQFEILKERDALLNYRPANAEYLKPALKNVDPDNFYTTTNVVLIGMAINKDLVSTADEPKNWTDILDSKWQDQIGVGSPNFSGSMGIWTVAMEGKYGWDFFEKLSKLNPLVGQSISDPLTTLNAGERKIAAAAAPDVVTVQASKGNPLKVIYPADGFVAAISPTAVLKTSKSPNVSKLFVNFLLSEEVAEINWARFATSVRGDLKEPDGISGTGDVKLIIPTAEQLAEKLLPLRQKWKETMGGM
ncbi:ABC transporter substrate-binding protein [Mesorhizobium sp. 1B3]|uniref:ABC transporter substrate-binding protein n=1 Tax=Mesorhizobium sp. 1B3 TaxID=3243599 RepID=UPI003D98EEAF